MWQVPGLQRVHNTAGKKKRNVQLIKMKSDMDVILIWLAICWEVEKGAGMSKKFTKEGKFELRLAEYLDG